MAFGIDVGNYFTVLSKAPHFCSAATQFMTVNFGSDLKVQLFGWTTLHFIVGLLLTIR